jgi:hypothetical protein
MALYPDCCYAFHIDLVHGYLAILIACFAMIYLSISYLSCLLRPDDLGKDVGSLCFRACLSVFLVHPKGGRPGGAGVVTSYMGVVLGYVGSFRYDGAPRLDWGRPQVVTTPFGSPRSCFVVSVIPDVRITCRSSCKDVTELDVLQRDILPNIPNFPAPVAPSM